MEDSDENLSIERPRPRLWRRRGRGRGRVAERPRDGLSAWVPRRGSRASFKSQRGLHHPGELFQPVGSRGGGARAGASASRQSSRRGRPGDTNAKHGRRSRHQTFERDGATNLFDRSKYATVITVDGITKLSKMEPAILVKRVDNQLKDFQQALRNAEIVRLESLNAVVLILSKLVSLASEMEGIEQSMASRIVAELLSTERCAEFHFHLNQAIKCSSFTLQQAENVCNVFIPMLNRFESLAWDCLPVDELYEAVKRLTKDSTRTVHDHSSLLAKVEELRIKRDQIRNSHTERDEERDDSKFKLIPILPEWKDIQEDSGTPPEVRPNKVDAPYKDWMEYYDIQFRLIREDFIAPLRRGVAAFLQGDKGNRDVKTYSGAKIVSQLTTKHKGICFSVHFDITGLHRVNWDHAKRLLFGSLLCLIRINEETHIMLFANVVDRDKVKEGKILVKFEGDIGEAMTHQKNKTEFELIDSNSYFDGAVRPILQSLQSAEVETMPFTRQLIRGECDAIPPPVYLCPDQDHDQVLYNLSCLYGPQRKLKPQLDINVLDKESWEAARDSELDSSQLNAIQTALTQEIAVIQGPPGTGKTYIGLKIVEALLDNREVWDPHNSSPILVMCYTNHALDQFLEGIIDTKCCGRKLDVIRVGGRCKNEKVEAHNLNKIRKHYYTEYSDEIGAILGQLHSCNPEENLRKVIRHHKRITLLPLHIIRHLANPYHYYQLQQMAQCDKHTDKEVEVWLELWTDELSESSSKSNSSTKHAERNVTLEKNEKEAKKHKVEHNISSSDLDKKPKSEEQDCENEEKLIDLQGEAILAEDNRMDADDTEGYQVMHLSDNKEETPPIEQHATSHDYLPNAFDYQNKVKCYRKSDANNIIRRKLFKERMSDHETENVEDIMELNIQDRWRLYNYWENQRYKYLQDINRESVDEYVEACKTLEELRQLEDGEILESADVVGMTTTGAAKYQHILHHIKPKIVIVEEAAEVLEAHIVSALSAGTQHLILIGDHKQLRPKPNEHVLATKYNLSISLFERLVMKQMSQATLEIQHRMRPEIARLVCPHVYEKLLNHESVEKYPDIRGISMNLFFFRHTEPESENPNLLSYQNEFEAKYIAGLCAHLLRLGYSPSQITILTPYVGQLLMLRNKMPKSEFEGVRVTAIDNFQGEENDIILFSMVRSTNPNSSRTTIGFVKEDNRVCVSLSRAKHGFYAIGNFELIRHQSQLWESIISDVESRGCYGDALPLYCCNHPETKYSSQTGFDFKAKAPNGGCKSTCNTRLSCGHACTAVCHVIHDRNYQCEKIYESTLACGHVHTMPCYKFPHCPTLCLMPTCEEGHTCKRKCHFPKSCGVCCEILTIKLPECSHEQNLKCYISKNPQRYSYICNKPCEKKLGCGHKCPKKCRERCQEYCQEEVIITFTCGHSTKVKCTRKERVVCKETCLKTLECGHPCSEMCGKVCTKTCRKRSEKQLPCGHKIECACFEMQRSEESGFTCNEKVSRPYPCGHICKVPCYSSIDSYPCEMKCKVILSCGHRCSGECGDCYSSRIHRVCTFETRLNHCCGYLVTLPCAGISDSCDHKTCLCTHGNDYSKCQEPCVWECQHYECGQECSEECDRPPCNGPCDKELRCGHRCPGLCGERCISVCIRCDTAKFMKQRVCIQCVHKKSTTQLHSTCGDGHRLSTNEFFFELNCGHIFIVRELDEYMGSESSNMIKPKQCPKCHKSIHTGNRYGNVAKKAVAYIENVKDLILQSTSIPEIEREELHHAIFWKELVVGGEIDEQDPLYNIRSTVRGLSSVQEKLDSALPVTAEESCLAWCADSVFSLYISLQSSHVELDIVCSNLKFLIEKLTDLAVVKECLVFGMTRFEMRLSWQLLKDFISELYRLALSAQCTIARIQLSSASQAVTGHECAVVAVEKFIASLHPVKDRISEAQYEEHYSRLSSAVPDVANIHVRTPDMPTVVKGTWMKCSAGHYYCVPPVCGARAKTTNSCPHCHT